MSTTEHEELAEVLIEALEDTIGNRYTLDHIEWIRDAILNAGYRKFDPNSAGDVFADHRIVEGPHKHQTVWTAWVRCRCGWSSERDPKEPLHWREPDLLRELRADHDRHVLTELGLGPKESTDER